MQLNNTHEPALIVAIWQIATQKGLVLCFRAMMNTPIGMEAIVHDAEPLELMGMSVFLASSPDSWLIQSVRRFVTGDLSWISLPSTDRGSLC